VVELTRAHDRVREAAAASVVGVVGLLVAAALLVRRGVTERRTDTLAVVVIPLLVAVRAISFLATAWPRTAPGAPYPMTGTHAFLAEHLSHDRFASPNGVMFPSFECRLWLAFRDFARVPAPELARSARRSRPEGSALPTLSRLTPSHSAATSPVLDRLGARYWVADPARGVFGTPAEAGQRRGGSVVLGEGGSVPAQVASGPKRGVQLEPLKPLVPTVLAVADGGSVYAAPVLPAADDLRLVFAGDALIYERRKALPRIRWASQAEVVPTPAERLDRLDDGVAEDAVLLNEGPGGGDGRPAQMEILEDSGDVIRVRVRARGAGWVVVADSLQHGWSARLGSEPTPLVPADHDLVAVAVPAGEDVVSASTPRSPA